MKIVVCDDQCTELEQIMTCCRAYLEEHNISAELSGFTDPAQLEGVQADILLLDVEMPGENGIDIKDRLAKEADSPWIIFITNYPNAISKAFNRNTIGFLLKPVQAEPFAKYMDIAINYLQTDKIIRLADNTLVNSKDVVWIVANQGYSDFQFADGSVRDGGRKSMKLWEAELEICGFIRISESYLVNARYIESYRDESVTLPNAAKKTEKHSEKVTFEIARRRRKECREKYLEFFDKLAKYT